MPVTERVLDRVAAPVTARVLCRVAAPATFISPPIHAALVTPKPPEVSRDPVEMLVASVTRVELIPAANVIRAVVVVCPSLVIAVESPIARSAVNELIVAERFRAKGTKGMPALLITNVPLPL